MKKLLLVLLLFITAITTKAQFTTGWDKAMNFGGAGADVEEMRYVNGDLYFFARMMGKYQFAGTNYDAGAIFSYPAIDIIYGKITSAGTQVLINRFTSANLSPLINGSRIGADGSLYVFRLATGASITFGTITAPAYGLQLLKVAPDGQFNWVKKLTTFSDIEFGTSAVPGPNFGGMQVKDNGEIYGIFKANTPRGSEYAARVIKLNASGDEVWNYEMVAATAGTSTAGIIISNMPKQFVDDAGNVTFKVASTGTISFNGESLPYEEPYTYAGFGNLKNWIISLDNTGAKKWSTSAYVEPALYGVNRTNGEVYINYAYGRQNPAKPPTLAPFSSLPNLAPPPPFEYLQPYYAWNGVVVLSTSGGIVKTRAFDYLTAEVFPTQMQMSDDGRILLYSGTANGSKLKAGNNFVSFDEPGFVGMEVDADFNPLTVFRLPAGSAVALNGSKFSVGGGFKSTLTVGSTTLTPYSIDTDFNTRFPSWVSIKTDVLIAEGNLSNMPTDLAATNWLGVNNNWNDAANWSGGIPTLESKVVFDANVANMPSVATTPKAGRVIINAGITASLPAALVITENIINNGVLKIDNALSYYNFSAYGAKSIQGNGELFFNGTAAGATTYASLVAPTTNTLTLNHAVQLSASVKELKFLGSTAILTGSIEITSPDVNAITGYSTTNYISGSVTRAVNPTGVYIFPNSQSVYQQPEPTTLTLNNLMGTTKITVANDNGATNPNVKFATGTTTTQLGQYYWRVTPDVAPTGGTYDISFQKSSFTNGVTDPDRYVVLKRIAKLNPWTFEGTKSASTQTGGTTSGQTVSNATVTAGLTGLTGFSEFTIGINSTAVPTNTTISTSTWTGTLNTEWNNVANWSSGIPNSTTDAVIPAGLTNYPAIYTTTDNARSLTIASGVTNLKLSSIIQLTNGLINNATIEIAQLAGYSGEFTGYGGGISGDGKLVFKKTGLITVIMAGVINNDIEIDISNTSYIWMLGKFGKNINVISGMVNGTPSSGKSFELTNPAATITVTAPINHIAGSVSKAVTTSGTFIFPIGDEQYHRNGIRKPGEITITNNAIASPTVYSVKFDSYWVAPLSLVIGTDIYTSFINSGQWSINPTKFSTTGTIDLTLKTSNYTNGRASTTDYVLFRRASTATNSADIWTIVPNASISEDAGTITVTAEGIAPFATNTMFCIGLKATTTTWTGTVSDNWGTVGNWTNGVPNDQLKAVFANVARYPSLASTPSYGSAAAAIEITAGSTLTLPSSFYTPNGIINNGTINISGNGTFYGFGSGSSFSTLSGSGKIVFGSLAPAIFDSYYMGNKLDNSIEVNKVGGLSLNRTTNFSGNVILTNGVVSVADYTYFTMTNPNATITGSATAYIKGNLKRSINSTGTYNFPVGTTGIYAPASVTLAGLTGTTSITTSFSDATINGQPNLTIGSSPVNSLLPGGSWMIEPNTSPTGGSYGVSLSAPKGTSTATDFYVLKRPYNGGDWFKQPTNDLSSVTAGMVTASTSGYTTFSQFGIGEGTSTLPIKLIDFTAKKVNNSISINWKTATELNSDKFLVERSGADQVFTTIGELKAKRNSNAIVDYSLPDRSPINGANYYRLKQVDLDGSYEYSKIVAVNFDLAETTVKVYPNPASTVLNFNGVGNKKGKIAWYNLSGQKIAETDLSNSQSTVPTSLNNGLYLIRVLFDDGSTFTQKISVVK